VIGLAESIIVGVRLYLMRRRQYDNEKLRKFFRENYGVDVGLYTYGCFDRWRMPGPMKVGRYCSFAKTVLSARSNHPMQALTTHPAVYERDFGVIDADVELGGMLTVEDDVWVGHAAVILPECRRIGRGAIVGAGSIVTMDVAPYTVVAGNPARKLRDRFTPELIDAIERSRWWEMDLAELRQLVNSHPDLVYRPGAETLSAWANERKGILRP
jgi:acetyltransferase-like isoleucine patch superfamily enzyme